MLIDPHSQTRPRSLRTRSTIITFSARSLAPRGCCSFTCQRLAPALCDNGRVPLLSRLYDDLLRPALYSVSGGDAEQVHARTLRLMALAERRP